MWVKKISLKKKQNKNPIGVKENNIKESQAFEIKIRGKTNYKKEP